MRSEEFRSRLRGVIAFPVTPFKADLSLDLAGLRKNIDQLLCHPIAAIVAAGGTGEMYSLTPAEHQAVVNAIVEEVQGKIPVLVDGGFRRGRPSTSTDAVTVMPKPIAGEENIGQLSRRLKTSAPVRASTA